VCEGADNRLYRAAATIRKVFTADRDLVECSAHFVRAHSQVRVLPYRVCASTKGELFVAADGEQKSNPSLG